MHSMKDRIFLPLVLVLVYQSGFSQNFVIPPLDPLDSFNYLQRF